MSKENNVELYALPVSADDDPVVGEEIVSEDVPPQYRGTATDRDDMRVLGNMQVLRRNFKPIGMVGFANSVMVMWETFLVTSGLGLSVGGRAPVFWGLIYGALTMPCIYLTIAELASIAPTAAGQYHWVSELAPPRFQKYLSYITGWQVSLGWLSYLTLVSFIAATTIQGLAVLNYPAYTPLPWHSTLLTWAIVSFGFLCNTLLVTYLPAAELAFFLLHILGWAAIWITLVVLAPMNDPYDTFVVFQDNAGWGSVGLAAVITMSNSVALFVGYESPVHMSEETQDASKVMPAVITWSVVMNVVMVLIMCGIYISAIGDLEKVLSTPTAAPFIQVFYDVTRSKSGASAMAAIVIVEMISASMSEGTCASRQIWSFARDGGLPFSGVLSATSKRLNIPIWAITTTVVFVMLISLINIGSTAALNALNALGGISILTTYLIVVGCYVWHRLTHERPPWGAWSRFGMVYAIVGFLGIVPVWFFLIWPLFNHPDAADMNWACTMWGGVVILASIWYLAKGRHTYTPPVDKVKRM